MATLTADRAKATFPVFKGDGAGDLCAAYGSYTWASALSTDTVQLCRLPAGAVVLGGWIMGDDLDTGTEALDFDIGWAANGVEVANPDGFGNFGVVTGDAFSAGNLSMSAGINYWLPAVTGSVLADTGPQAFTNETIITMTINAAANAGGTGTISIVLLYVVP
ncbi:MAG: hypothetical protein U1E25_15060 [Methylocystis sp.]